MCFKCHSDCLLILATPLLPGNYVMIALLEHTGLLSFFPPVFSPLLFSFPFCAIWIPTHLVSFLIIHNFLLNAIREFWGEKVLDMNSLWAEDWTLKIWLSVCFLQTSIPTLSRVWLCQNAGGALWLWPHSGVTVYNESLLLDLIGVWLFSFSLFACFFSLLHCQPQGMLHPL